jgi:outer membrane protein TolC
MTRTHVIRFAVAAAAALTLTGTAFAQPEPGGGIRTPSQAVDRVGLTLDEAVRRAIEHNPDLAIVRVAVDVEGARVLATRSAFEPVFTSLLGRASSAAPPTSSFLGSDAIDTDEWFSSAGVRQRLRKGGGTWNVSWQASRIGTSSPISSFDPSLQSGLLLAFSQPLFKDRKIDAARHQYIVADRQRQTTDLALKESVVQTVASVKQAYWTLKAARAHVTVQQRSVELAEDLVRQNRARVQVGQTPPLDLVQAEAEVAQRRENLIRAEATAHDAEDHLRRLIMDPNDASFWRQTLDPVDEPPASVGPPDVDGAVAGALRDRYDLARARMDAGTSQATIDFYGNQKQVDVRLEASYRAGGSGGTELLRTGPFPGTVTGRLQRGFGDTLGQLFTNDFPAWTVGLTVNYPLGKSYEEASYARAELEHQQAQHRIASLHLQIAEAVRQAGRQVQSTAERVEAARAGETLAEQRYGVEQRRFEVGLSTTFLVTQAQRDLLQAQVNLLQAMLDHQSARINFDAAQLAGPQSANASIGVRGADVVVLPVSAPNGIARQGAGVF